MTIFKALDVYYTTAFWKDPAVYSPKASTWQRPLAPSAGPRVGRPRTWRLRSLRGLGGPGRHHFSAVGPETSSGAVPSCVAPGFRAGKMPAWCVKVRYGRQWQLGTEERLV